MNRRNKKFSSHGLTTSKRGGRAQRFASLLFVSALCLAAAGCSKKDAPKKAARTVQQPSIEKFATKELPSKVEPLDVDFSGKAKLVGYRIKPTEGFKRGQHVTLTLYWKSLAPIDAGYELVGHVLDEAGESVMNLANHGPLRNTKGGKHLLPPSSWKPGHIYADEVRFKIPKRVKTATVRVVVSIAKKGGAALAVTKGATGDKNSASVLTLDLVNKRKASGSPDLRVNRLAPGAKIVVDGKLDEEGWQTAVSTGAFVSHSGSEQRKPPLAASARLLWNDEGLLVGFEVTDKDVTGGFKPADQNPDFRAKDAVGITLHPMGPGKQAYELLINPQNLTNAKLKRAPGSAKAPADAGADSGVETTGEARWSANIKSKVVVHGTVDKSDEDKGYTVEVLIPWKSFEGTPQAPAVGDAWRLNLFAIEANAALSWAPLSGGSSDDASHHRVLFTERTAAKGQSVSPSASASSLSSSRPAPSSKPAPTTTATMPGPK